MRVEMMTVPDCPNGPVLKERLVLALAGRTDVELTEHVVDDQAEAEHRGMYGSPTLLVDGRDPFAAPGTEAACPAALPRSGRPDRRGTVRRGAAASPGHQNRSGPGCRSGRSGPSRTGRAGPASGAADRPALLRHHRRPA